MTVLSLTHCLAVWLCFLTAGCTSYSVDRFDENNSRVLADEFLSGRLVLSCERATCAGALGYNLSKLRELYDGGDWKQLSKEIIRIGAPQDLSYFLLGRSAEGLGAIEAARIYYEMAIELALSQKGGDTCFDPNPHFGLSPYHLCEGLRVPSLARAGLRRISEGRPAATPFD